jgi:hypothetical protein
MVAVGSVAGAEMNRTGGPVATLAAKPVEWIGDAAPTIPTTRPSAGCPPKAMNAAIARRIHGAPNSTYSWGVWR